MKGKEIKTSDLISMLKELLKKHGDLDIVINANSDGWYNLEEVDIFKDEDGEEFINLSSSNDTY